MQGYDKATLCNPPDRCQAEGLLHSRPPYQASLKSRQRSINAVHFHTACRNHFFNVTGWGTVKAITFHLLLYFTVSGAQGELRSLNHSCLIMILLLNFFLIIGFCFKFHFFHFLSRAFLHISITDQFSKMVNSLFPTL